MRNYWIAGNLRVVITVLSVGLLAPFGVSPASAFEEIRPGVYRSDWRTIDDLLTIRDQAELSVLTVRSTSGKRGGELIVRGLTQ